MYVLHMLNQPEINCRISLSIYKQRPKQIQTLVMVASGVAFGLCALAFLCPNSGTLPHTSRDSIPSLEGLSGCTWLAVFFEFRKGRRSVSGPGKRK